MKVAELLTRRRDDWNDLERRCARLEGSRRGKIPAEAIARFAALYRDACADLAIADSYDLPPETVSYLHRLVGRAHNQLYRSETFHPGTWAHEMLVALPQRLYKDPALRLAFAIFWGCFFGAMLATPISPEFANTIVGREALEGMEQMHAESVSGAPAAMRFSMVGFYIRHNAGIGLQCFAFGLTVVMGLYVLLSNALILGTTFGYMATTPQRDNFLQFVTAHGPFELTAIVVAAAAGLRIGFSIVSTGRLSRSESLMRASRESLSTVALAVILFVLAAMLEGLLSPSRAPYVFKVLAAAISSGMLLFYFVFLGNPRKDVRATR